MVKETTEELVTRVARNQSEDVLRVKVRDVVQVLEEDGWYLVTTRGSHRQFKHKTKSGRVTVPGKPGDDLAPGTLNSIWKQAQLTRR